MKLNKPVYQEPKYTFEGARASYINAEQELRRLVMAHLLWEDTFYVNGKTAATQISRVLPKVDPLTAARIAVEAREVMKLRHTPLFLAVEMAKSPNHKQFVSGVVRRVVQRPDEITELLAIYSKGRTGVKKLNKLSKQIQKGIAAAFREFDEYQLSKWNRDSEIKLKDALFLSHAKPLNKDQADLWDRLINDKLAIPDTWEVALSASKGENKRVVWERLLLENRVPGFALLANLRNIYNEGVPMELIAAALDRANMSKVLPFRFISAARAIPQLEPLIEPIMLRCLGNLPKLVGKTALLVDNSGSMTRPISGKSWASRAQAAQALAILVREVCEEVDVISFSTTSVVVPPRRGFALADAIKTAVQMKDTNIETAIQMAKLLGYDRIIIITDEQSSQEISDPGNGKLGYIMNVAAYQNGIGYDKGWIHVEGWSEGIVNFIRIAEEQALRR